MKLKGQDKQMRLILSLQASDCSIGKGCVASSCAIIFLQDVLDFMSRSGYLFRKPMQIGVHANQFDFAWHVAQLSQQL